MTKKTPENEKRKYLLIMYKESEHWAGDSERSEFRKVYTDNLNEFIDELWYRDYQRKDWEIYAFVGGVEVHLNSFEALLQQRRDAAEKARQEYHAKCEADRLEQEAERAELVAKMERETYKRLKAKFEGT